MATTTTTTGWASPRKAGYTRDRADPGFWAGQRPLSIAGAGLGLVLIVLLIALLL
ncbi:MAG: hypothetical protein WKF40_05075 [Thermoleophilaceae bacterium]